VSKNEIDIIPPSQAGRSVRSPDRTANGVTYAMPRTDPGGIISSALTRWEANRHARVFESQTARTRAEATLFDAQVEAIEAYVRRARALHRLGELPEILAGDRDRRRADRAEEWREIEHQGQLAERRRMTELAHVESVLVDADQALRAQREFGYVSHELAWKKKNCEILDVDLDAAERRALLREAERGTGQATPGRLSEEELIEQLYERRQELRADGLDTSRVDAALASVGKK
jgi:hypothetical protein